MRLARFKWPADAPADRSILGEHAKRLLADPVLGLAFERIERTLTERLFNTKLGESEQREAAYRLHWAVEQLKAELQTILGDSKVLEHEEKLRAEREEKQRKRRERI